MKFVCLISFCLVLAAALPARAQGNDYLVTTSGDTLRGKVKILSFDIDQAQVKTSNQKKTFKATQVSVLKVGDMYYRPQRRQNSYRFMQLLHNGYLSLYGFKDTGQNTFDSRFLVKKDGSSMDLPNLGFKKGMTKFLDDCASVSASIEEGRLGRNNIDEIIDNYNFCIGEATRQRYELSKMYIPATSPKLVSLDNLKKKVESLADFSEQKNALDLLADIREKVSKSAAVPAYQLAGLKEYLGSVEGVKDELSAFLNAVAKPNP